MNEDLWSAAESGKDNILDRLITGGAIVNQFKHGWTPLCRAAANGHVNCVKLLVERGAEVVLAEKDGWIPLYWAAANGHVDCMKLLLKEGANVDFAEKDLEFPLSWAADIGNVDCLNLLLQGGVNVNLADKFGATPLQKASTNGHEACVKLLLEGDANVDLANKDEWSPLYSAVAKGHVECVKLLLNGGAKVDLADKLGWTPLYRAAANNNADCVTLLLKGGANVDLVNRDGWTPLYRAAANSHVDCLKLLLEGGANVDHQDKTGGTPLTVALSNKYTDNVLELIANGAKVNYRASLFTSNPYALRDKEGRIALHVAVQRGRNKKIVLPIIQAFPKSVDIRDNSGKTPLDSAVESGTGEVSTLWLLFELQKSVKKNVIVAYPLLYAATRMTRRIIQSVHIHLVGHGYAGKTTCRRALNKTLKILGPMKFAVFGDHKDVFVDRSNGSGKTEGMEMDSIESPHHKWLIRDYGGQEDFHVNHARFLSVPGSIYVIVAALWDEARHKQFEIEEVGNRLMYWLKFLNSIATVGTEVQCIVVINFSAKVDGSHAVACLDAVKSCIVKWNSGNLAVKIFGDPCVITVSNVDEVRKLNEALHAASSSQEANIFPVLAYINAVEKSFVDNVQKLKGKLKKRSEFVKTVCLPAVLKLLSVDTMPVGMQHVSFVCDKMIEYLCASGKIIVVSTTTTHNDPLIVLDVNWLSKELLGSLINALSMSGREEFVLTAKEIDTFTNNCSEYFGGVEGLVSFLESIGACVSVTGGDSATEVKRWFPLCGQRKFVGHGQGKECVAMEKGVWNKYRKVVRLFKLSDPVHQMFPPGYFIDMFLKILSSFSMKSTKTVKVFINGMDVLYQLTDSRLQVLLVVLDDNCSFTLEVSYASRIASTTFSSSEYWKRFSQVCDLIMNPKEVYAAKDIFRVSPWLDNVQLTDMFVDPTKEALIKAQLKLANDSSLEVKEVRDTKSLADLLDREEAIQHLYIYGCDETDMPVNEEDPPRHILEIISGKVDKIQQQLNERWNRVTVDEASTMIQEALNTMTNSLKESRSTELLAIVEASRQAVCEDFLSVSHLQSVIDQLRSDISGNITSENAQVLTELNQMQETMKELTSEVHNIQHVNDRALQSAILKAIDESKTLHRINNMMQTVVRGTSDVPTMAIVIPVTKKGSLLSSFNPSNWTSNEYSMYFVCSHSHQVVPCGPDGKGYKFKRPKEWFKKAAPLIKVCLIAAKIALTISGIPIPISGLVDAIDASNAIKMSLEFVNTAQEIFDASTEDASDTSVIDFAEADRLVDSDDDDYVVDKTGASSLLASLLRRSDTISAYKAIKALLDEVDPTLGSVGVEKATSESGVTGWVKKGDQELMVSFMRDEKWPMKINELKESYNEAVAASSGVTNSSEGQSQLGERSGLWLPKSLFGRKK